MIFLKLIYLNLLFKIKYSQIKWIKVSKYDIIIMKGDVNMSKFIQNLSQYIEHYRIKNNFIVKLTGIEKNKFSRLLNGKQDIQYEDMEKISKCLGKEVSFFMEDNMSLTQSKYEESTSIAFYMGAVDESKKELANQIFDFLEHVDAILGIQKKIDKDSCEVLNYEF